MTYIVETFGRTELGTAETLEEAREIARRRLFGAPPECATGGCPDDDDLTGIEAWVDPTLDDRPELQAELAIYILREDRA